MASKKQRRMEQDTNAGERGKPPKQKPGIKVSVDGVDTGQFYDAFKVDAEQVERIEKQVEEDAKRIAERWTGAVKEGDEYPKISGGMFGGSPKASGGPAGYTVIGGVEELSKKFGQGFDASKIMAQTLEMYNAPSYALGEARWEDSLARLIWDKAMQIWDYPTGWRLTVTLMQMSHLLTVEYLDPEEEATDPLVKMSVAFTEEMLQRDDPELIVERELEKLKDKCEAEKAMFEE